MPILHYQIDGEHLLQQGHRPLLILHGFFGSLKNWSPVTRQLKLRFPVISVDLRNHGQSFHHPTMDYLTMSEDINNLLEHLQLGPVDLMGHSMGGKVAMMFCQRFPAHVHKLLVADIAPVAYVHSYTDLIYRLLTLDLQQLENRRDANQQLKESIPDIALRQFLLQNLKFTDGKPVWRINWQAILGNHDEIIGFPSIDGWQVPEPSLFIVGKNSDYVTPGHWELVKKHFPQAYKVSIKEAGHWLHAEQPQAVIDTILYFIEN